MEQQERRTFTLKKYWPIFAGIMIILVGFGLYQLLNTDPKAGDKSSVTTSTIQTGDIRVSAIGSGTLISAVEVELGFEYGGVVEEILVETGDYVEEGQLLATLDDDQLVENLEKMEADLRELTSDAAVAAAAMEIAGPKRQSSVLNLSSGF